MATIRQVRQRIKVAKNIQQITKAMKMVAAARLKRAQDRVQAARPYAATMREMMTSLAQAVGGEVQHPLLVGRPPRNVGFLIVTSDRGLAGSYNSAILRRAMELEQIDQLFLLYTRFFTAITQRPTDLQLLPLQQPEVEAVPSGEGPKVDYIFEPSADLLLRALLPRYLEGQVYQALLESVASEHGARMTAMNSATDNAGKMITTLTLQLNRARQAGITREISEIVGGAEALKG
jgi:F-type H+-transporting ATPase subunit gamma